MATSVDEWTIISRKNNKTLNPYHKGTKDKYIGSVNKYDFKRQKKNYDKLVDSLKPFGIYLDEVYSSVIERKYRNFITFLVSSSNPYFYWHKYESGSSAAGQNFIIIDGIKTKLSTWLSYDDKEREKIINPILEFNDEYFINSHK